MALVIIIIGGLGLWLFLAGLYGVTPAELLSNGGKAQGAGDVIGKVAP